MPEVWLRGQVPNVPAIFQPVAHALLQCQEDVNAHLPALTPDEVWARPNDAASIGFHIRHAAGSLDRLFTYARGGQLSAEQMAALKKEGAPDLADGAAERLIAHFNSAIERALVQLRGTDPDTWSDARRVGRAQLPSTVLGLLFHAAEHTQRHVGQMITMKKILPGA